MSNEKKDLFGLNQLTEKGRDIWLAGLGALSVAEQEGNKVFASLIEKGTALESRGRDQIEEVVNKLKGEVETRTDSVKDRVTSVTDKVEGTVTTQIESVLSRLEVPTRGEVKKLTAKVENLMKKVEALTSVLEKDGAAKKSTTKAKAK